MNQNAGATGSEGRTRTFSLRLTEAELAKIHEMALRLGASEAAVIRYAIRSMLNRVAPLYDPNAKGFSLIPVFVECGAELTSYFDLDVNRLEHIINGDGGNGSGKPKIEKDDLALLAMSGLREPQVHAKLRELKERGVEQDDVPQSLRSYFYDKYIYESYESSTEKDGD